MSRAETTAMLSKLVEKRLKNRVSYWASEVNFDLGTPRNRRIDYSEPPRPYCRGFRAFRRDDCFRHGYMTSYEVTPRFRGLLHAHVVLPVGRLAWPGDI